MFAENSPALSRTQENLGQRCITGILTPQRLKYQYHLRSCKAIGFTSSSKRHSYQESGRGQAYQALLNLCATVCSLVRTDCGEFADKLCGLSRGLNFRGAGLEIYMFLLLGAIAYDHECYNGWTHKDVGFEWNVQSYAHHLTMNSYQTRHEEIQV